MSEEGWGGVSDSGESDAKGEDAEGFGAAVGRSDACQMKFTLTRRSGDRELCSRRSLLEPSWTVDGVISFGGAADAQESGETFKAEFKLEDGQGVLRKLFVREFLKGRHSKTYLCDQWV